MSVEDEEVIDIMVVSDDQLVLRSDTARTAGRYRRRRDGWCRIYSSSPTSRARPPLVPC